MNKIPFEYGSIAENPFITDIDGMPASQIAFLRAVCMGETYFNAQQVVAEYGLGAPRTITKNKKSLVEPVSYTHLTLPTN